MKAVSPTRIVDKNGKSTVVYRKMEEAPGVNKSLTGRLPRSAAADKKRQAWRESSMSSYMVRGDRLSGYEHADLKAVLGESTSSDRTYYMLAPGTTQEELAGMLSVAAPATVLKVSGAQQIRSADQLCDYLESVGLSHLIEDNSEQMELIEHRMVDAGALIESLDQGLSPAAAQCSWADLAEVISCRTFSETEMSESVWAGSVSWDFIKSVGISNVRQFGSEIIPYADELTAEQFKSGIALVRSGSNVVPGRSYSMSRIDEFNETVYAMLRIGPETPLSMRAPGLFREMNQKGLLLDLPDDQKALASKFADDLIHRIRETGAEVGELVETTGRDKLKGYPAPIKSGPAWDTKTYKEYAPPIKDIVEFFKAGISVDDTITYMSRGINAEKARGLIDDNIAAPVSDGWL